MNVIGSVQPEFHCSAFSRNETLAVVTSHCNDDDDDDIGIGCTSINQVNAAVINTECNGFQASATLIEGAPSSVSWSGVNFPGAAIANNSPYNFTAQNVQPGQYTIQLMANYNMGASGTCSRFKNITFIVPYKAGIKYNVTCNGSSYNVQLLDFSVYYPQTPIEHFAFTIDGGLNWYPATFNGGIPQFNTTLLPGSYTIGIRINSAAYAECTHFETLVLPPMPSAAFTASTNNCQYGAVQFTALDNNPDLQYNWNFSDGSSNLQQNPVRVFNGFNDFAVQLTVTNRFGCSAISTQFVNVMPVNMMGELIQTPLLPCEGETTTLHFQPNVLTIQDTPTSITWYHNSIEAPPIATTTGTNLDVTVNQSGYYIAHLTDANGCVYKRTPAIAVAFVPTPEAPQITGTTLVCENGVVNVSVPANPSVNYQWSINGVAQAAYNNFSTIEFYPTATGTYNFSVTASVTNGSGESCTSLPASLLVSVVPEPVLPELEFEVISCEPYLVKVSVTNVQTGALYYWSNGTSGPSTYMSHDGPIQVRAEINGCTATAQLDLPIDIDAVAWVFPTGCFENCEQEPLGYIIGPNGDFDSWSWLQDGSLVMGGSNVIMPYSNVVATHDYQLFLSNGFCSQTIENLNMQSVRCEKCDIKYEIRSITCEKINNEYVYLIDLVTFNPYSTTLFMNLVAPNNEGFFMNNTLALTTGTAHHLFYFFPFSGFNGGTVLVETTGALDEETQCNNTLKIRFPRCTEGLPRTATIAHQGEPFLLVAPNPAQEETKVFYNFSAQENATAEKTIEVLDLLGRTITTTRLTTATGIELLDTSRYAAGQYLVLLKQGGVVIKTVKLVIKN